MDAIALIEKLPEIVPDNLWDRVVGGILSIEHNANHIAPEIYDPKHEVKIFLKDLAPDAPWVRKVLDLVDAA